MASYRASSNHTTQSADGARISFVTAKQTELEILEFLRAKRQKAKADAQLNQKQGLLTGIMSPRCDEEIEIVTVNDHNPAKVRVRHKVSLSLTNQILERLEPKSNSNTESELKSSQVKVDLIADPAKERK